MSTRVSVNTGKRKRRRYSCGPCKSLKIKCNLETPCAACKKVGREERCLEDPPMPPSSEEISISNRRKSLTRRKKQLLALSNEKNFRGSSVELDRQTDDTLGDGSHKKAVTSEMKSQDPVSHVLFESPGSGDGSSVQGNDKVSPASVQYTPLDRMDGSMDSKMALRNTSISSLHPSLSSTPLSDYQIYPPVTGRVNSSIAENNFPSQEIEDIVLNPHVNNYQYYDESLSQIISDQHSLAGHKAEFPFTSNEFLVPLPYIPNPHNNGLLITPIQSSSTLIETEDLNSKRVLYTFNHKDLDILKTFLPPFALLEELQNQYKISSSNSYYCILDHEENLRIFKDFYVLVQSLSSVDTIKIDKYSLKCISKFYCIMAISYLLSGNDNELIVNLDKLTVIQGWINISSMIRCVIVDPNHVVDILFSIEWYFIVRDFFTYNDLILDDYASFSSILKLIKLNTLYTEAIQKGSSKSMNSDFSRLIEYWINLRIVDLEVPYFLLKGTFAQDKVFENSFVPDKQTFMFLYESLDNISDPYRKISCEVMRLYFNRTQYNAPMKLFLKSYLDFFCDVGSLLYDDLTEFKSKSSEPDFEVRKHDLETLIRNQFCAYSYIKWLSFISIENKYYFPGLRYTHYFLTVLTLFNHFATLDDIITRQSQRSKSLVDRLLENYSYVSFGIFVRCLVYQGIFLITIKNFKDATRRAAIDCTQIFETIKNRFHNTFNRFWKNEQMHKRLYRNLLLFRKLFDLCHDLCHLIETDHKFSSLDDFMAHLQIKLREYGFLSDSLFGSNDSLRLYIDILWRFFSYLTTTDTFTKIQISKKIFITTDFINNASNDLAGLTMTTSMVEEYFALIIEPNVSD